MKKLVFGMIILLLMSCKETAKLEFSMKGTTNGIDNGTILYLKNVLNGNRIDSTIVNNDSFLFKPKQIESPLLVVLETKDGSLYRVIWLENNQMTFDGTRTTFDKAIVTGSESDILIQSLIKEVGSLPRDERREKEIEFVKNNPNSRVSAHVLSTYATTWGKRITKELFEQFSTENKTSAYAEKIKKYIRLNKDPKIGEKFVDFEMKDSKGNLKRLSDLNGKVVLLEFWASWCQPCLRENPNLVKTYKRFNSKGFEIFAVSLDQDKNSWLNAIEKDNLNWEHVSDLKGFGNEALIVYGINGIPNNFLIDDKGVIIGRNLRGELLNQKLTEILN